MKTFFTLTITCLQLTLGLSQDIISDNSDLTYHRLFGAIEIAVPENAHRQEKNRESVEAMGFAHFTTPDKKIEIKVRKMDEADLSQVKILIDTLSKSLYNGTFIRSEIVKINGIDVFVIDIKGQWNGTGEVIGMFRYYLNAKGSSYNLLMRYPAALTEKTHGLKERLLQSIKIVQ